MTNEEAIARIKEHKIVHKMNEPRAIYISEALDMAIKALEQQQNIHDTCKKCIEFSEFKQYPVEDCISRKDVNVLVDELARAISDERCFISRGRSTANIMQDILDLSSVIPAIPTGKWIDIGNEGIVFICSLCGDKNMIESHFCPNCGARMETETKNRADLNFADQDTMMPAT